MCVQISLSLDYKVSESVSLVLMPLSFPLQVRFSEQVEFFFASGDEDGPEDRRGPWEQLARDRCRFLRRCQEVELSIGPCLQPQHRRQVYLRLTATQLPQP